MSTKKSKKNYTKSTKIRNGGSYCADQTNDSIEIIFSGGSNTRSSVYRKVIRLIEEIISEDGVFLHENHSEATDYPVDDGDDYVSDGSDIRCHNTARFVFRLYR